MFKSSNVVTHDTNSIGVPLNSTMRCACDITIIIMKCQATKVASCKAFTAGEGRVGGREERAEQDRKSTMYGSIIDSLLCISVEDNKRNAVHQYRQAKVTAMSSDVVYSADKVHT